MPPRSIHNNPTLKAPCRLRSSPAKQGWKEQLRHHARRGQEGGEEASQDRLQHNSGSTGERPVLPVQLQPGIAHAPVLRLPPPAWDMPFPGRRKILSSPKRSQGHGHSHPFGVYAVAGEGHINTPGRLKGIHDLPFRPFLLPGPVCGLHCEFGSSARGTRADGFWIHRADACP